MSDISDKASKWLRQAIEVFGPELTLLTELTESLPELVAELLRLSQVEEDYLDELGGALIRHGNVGWYSLSTGKKLEATGGLSVSEPAEYRVEVGDTYATAPLIASGRYQYTDDSRRFVRPLPPLTLEP